MVNFRICECGKDSIYFRTEDAGKTKVCPACGREYTVFIEFEEDSKNYELYAEPNEVLLVE